MATYKEIKGVTVQALDDDPVEFVGTWASGGSMNTARDSVGSSSAGTQTASIVFAGSTPPDPTVVAINEQYNGSSWTETTEMNTDRDNVGASGSTTSALVWGGDIPPGTVQTLTEYSHKTHSFIVCQFIIQTLKLLKI